jgi:hypothetical protein
VTKGATIYTLIAVRGDAEHLKQTVDGLLLAADARKAAQHGCDRDCGLTGGGRKMANSLPMTIPVLQSAARMNFPTYLR